MVRILSVFFVHFVRFGEGVTCVEEVVLEKEWALLPYEGFFDDDDDGDGLVCL